MISLVIHISIATIGVFLLLRFQLWSYSLLYTFVAIACYCILGYFLLSNQGSRLKNALSISSVAFFGVFICVSDYYSCEVGGGVIDFVIPGFLSFMYNIPIYPIFNIIFPQYNREMFGLPSLIHFLWLPFIPSILLWIILEIKIKIEALKSKSLRL